MALLFSIGGLFYLRPSLATASDNYGDSSSSSSSSSSLDLDNFQSSLRKPSATTTKSSSTIDDHIESLKYMGHVKTNTGWYVDTLCLRQHNNNNNGEQQPSLLVYGVGAGEDISWDIGMIENYNAQVLIIDPTEKARRHVESVLHDKEYGTDPQKVKFIPQGLSNKNGEIAFVLPANPDHVSMRAYELRDVASTVTQKVVTAPVRTLQDIMKDHGHTYLDVLKIDIEGAEYDVLESLLDQQYLPFTQLLVEYHQRFLKKEDKQRHENVKKRLQRAGFVQLWAQNGGQEVGYVKQQDLPYCDDGISPRSPSVVETIS
jgi:FkbM family methyltransferase